RDCERRLRQEVQKYSVELRHAHETERHRVARELHDEVGQTLTALNYTLERMALHSSGTGIEIAKEASSLVADLTSRVGDLCLALRPHVLDDFGLGPALIWLTQRFEQQTGILVELLHDGLAKRLPREVELGVYRLIQEALTNIARHAGAKRCAVRCASSPENLVVSVRDYGVGFQVDRLSSGLRGMDERVQELGGRLTIRSSPGQGTCIRAKIPLPIKAW
ncbi:sensor histidine kinase, partial [Pseudonocardia asaccharolytica]